MDEKHYYVRNIANPNEVLAFGHAEAGKYTVPAGFEEVEGELPDAYTFVRLPTLAEQLEGLLTQAVANDAPVALKAKVRQVSLAVSDALKAGALDEVYYLIDSFKAPAEFSEIKQSMLSLLQTALDEA